MVRVRLPDGNEVIRGQEAIPLDTILHDLGINPEEVLVSRNGELVPESEATGGDDVIRIFRISHGG